MVSPTDDETQSTHRRGDLVFAGGALIGVGLLLFVARDQSSVTGILRPELTAAIAIAMIILGAFAVVLEVGDVLELSAKSRRQSRREKRAASEEGAGLLAPVDLAEDIAPPAAEGPGPRVSDRPAPEPAPVPAPASDPAELS